MRNNDIKTSEEWSQIINNVQVVDPDGWNRSNFQYSWFEEKIPVEEYINRVEKSTIKMRSKENTTIEEIFKTLTDYDKQF